jgi:superfamily II DNA or RNA helicase
MRITVERVLYVEDLPDVLFDTVWRELSATNPEYARRERLGLWLGEVDELVTLVDVCECKHVLPRGYIGRLLDLARKHGVEAIVDDRRLLLPRVDISFKGELRGYQKRALDAMTKHGSGVLVAPCGSGKTALGMALIAHLKQPALILVPTLDLLKQTAEAARRWLGVEPPELGVIGGGKFSIGSAVTVATNQTACRRPELSDMFGLVLQDEAHHTGAATFTQTLQSFPGAYRFGLTATPKRDDGLESFMINVIGPIRHEISRRELEEANALVIPDVEFVRTSFTYEFTDDWADLIAALIRDTDRNELLCGVSPLGALACVSLRQGLPALAARSLSSGKALHSARPAVKARGYAARRRDVSR